MEVKFSETITAGFNFWQHQNEPNSLSGLVTSLHIFSLDDFSISCLTTVHSQHFLYKIAFLLTISRSH